ncbi:MAG: HEAT repeat domain-containing protein [Candidatus Hodarchaeota archaeon]
MLTSPQIIGSVEPSQTARIATLIREFVYAWPGGKQVFEERLYTLLRKRDSDTDLIDFFMNRIPYYARANKLYVSCSHLIRMVKKLADPRLLGVLLVYLQHPSSFVRFEAVLVLSKFIIPPDQLTELLEPLLVDRSMTVRGITIKTLVQTADSSALWVVLQNVLAKTGRYKHELVVLEKCLRQQGNINPELIGEALVQAVQIEEISEQGLSLCLRLLNDQDLGQNTLISLQPLLLSLLFTTYSTDILHSVKLLLQALDVFLD